MKLQQVTVIFIIIFMPILLVTSYFISLQVNTIKLESSYDEKLLNATYDAMTAFELNTANEDLSSVSDSLRSIIDASNNIFFNTLCTNLGISNASKSFIQPYIPAILYTLYDGYYIYSPTNVPEICVDKYGRTIRTSDYGVKLNSIENGIGIYEFDQDSIIYSKFTPTEPAENPALPEDKLQTAPSINYLTLDSSIKEEYGQILYKNNDGTYSVQLHTWSGNRNASTYYKRSYILKSYIPYSATYRNNDESKDVTINYTLDNFMTIEGNINGVYYTKSGYFIDKDLINTIEVDGFTLDCNDTESWKRYSEETLNEYINDPTNHEVKVNLTDGISISNRDGHVLVSKGDGSGSEPKYWDDAKSAVKYYVDSYIFSEWVHQNLNDIQAKDLKNAQYSVTDIYKKIESSGDIESITHDSSGNDIKTNLYKKMLYNFSGDNTTPFGIDDNDPEDGESKFYKHKRNVIKNSITYNLILSMLVYTEESRTVEFSMPVLDEVEWDRILHNVSIVTFMEGMKCGLKYYNNYAIVTSTNNEISVTENEIYYVPRILQDIDTAPGAKIISAIDDDFSEDGENEYEIAHRIDCNELILGETNNFYNTNWLGCISFKSKEIKYDKILNSDGTYTYDHKVYTDYNCIVDSNYTVKNVNNSKEDGNTDILEYLTKNVESTEAGIDTNLQNNLRWKLKAYRIAIAKERNNLYKTTAFSENYGCQVVYLGDVNSGKKLTSGSVTVPLNDLPDNRSIGEIKKIEITIEGATQKKAGVYTSEISVRYNDGSEYSINQTVSTTSSNRRTLEFVQDLPSSAIPESITISANDIEFTVEAVKVYYK